MLGFAVLWSILGVPASNSDGVPPPLLALTRWLFDARPNRDGDPWHLRFDCDDSDPEVNPAAAEIPYDGKDNDCNPSTPDNDADGDGWPVLVDRDDRDPTIR